MLYHFPASAGRPVEWDHQALRAQRRQNETIVTVVRMMGIVFKKNSIAWKP